MNDNIIFGNTVRDSLLAKQLDNETRRAKSAEQCILEKTELEVAELDTKLEAEIQQIDTKIQHIEVNDSEATECTELDTITVIEPDATSTSYTITRVRRVINCLSSGLNKNTLGEDDTNE